MPNVLVVYNPFSGNGKMESVHLPKIKALLEKKGLTYQCFETTLYADFAQQLIATIEANKDAQLVVAGGDGTLYQVLNAIHPQYQKPIGFLQIGTGNDFSQAVGYPKRLEKQLELALFAEPKKVDLWYCNQMLFLNGVGIGFDGEVANRVNELRQKGQISKPTYWLTILKTLFNFRHFPANVSWQDENGEEVEFSTPLFMATLGNGVAFGGGFKLTPCSSLNDGLVDVCLIRKVSIPQRIWRLLFIPFGKHTNMSVVKYHQTQKVTISFSQNVPAHIDGEPFKASEFKIHRHPFQVNLRY
ncbi:MAG: diacylglycerol kinase family lipid kinase [Bacteroidetes bacterium]|nr:diacylglycerol kinase family lipid kinase [Bacteroidota bacterium]